MWQAIDLIAGRIRTLGALAPQGCRAFANLSGVQDGDPEKNAEAMLVELARDHEIVVATARALLGTVEAAQDEVTDSLLAGRMAAHEKHAWTLRATLGGR